MTDVLTSDRRARFEAPLGATGLVLAVAPFFLSFRETHAHSFVMSADGAQISQATQRTPFDYVAVPCGAIALVIGLFVVFRALPGKRLGAVGVGVCAAALGLLHVIQGLMA